MGTINSTESFFLADEFSCRREKLPFQTYNLAHVLLNRSDAEHIFIPIRSMQYLAIIEADTIWFVDSMAYAVRDSQGGRLITVSWQPLLNPSQREGLDQHMECKVTFYGGDMTEINQRLHGEFFQAMKLMDERYRESIESGGEIAILPLRPSDRSG